MMSLGDKQRLFPQLFAKLVIWAYANGYEFSFGEVTRSDEQAEINAIGTAGRADLCRLLKSVSVFWPLADKIANNTGSGIRNSLHELRLAMDLNLFINGAYIADPVKYKPIGEYWKTLHPLCCWGGDFSTVDANHISLTHDGRK